MTSDEIFGDMVEQFARRKFCAGLLVSFIDLLVDLEVPRSEIKTFDGLVSRYPRRTETASGGRANTLILDIGNGKTTSLRPFYNNIEKYFRSDQKRYDYPSCPGHATQAWPDYRGWIDGLCGMSSSELGDLRDRVVAFVLAELPSQEYPQNAIAAQVPLFEAVLESFDLTSKKREPTGAALQGIAFGFIRADNPHLQVEIDKVRTGSRRLQRVGDVDAWEGQRLAISAEVKQFRVDEAQMEDLRPFAGQVSLRDAIGLLVAVDFTDGARMSATELGLHPMSVEDLLRIVRLWDPAKQRIAVESMLYYTSHVEKNSTLTARLSSFIESLESRED